MKKVILAATVLSVVQAQANLLTKDSAGWSVVPQITNTKYSSASSGKDTNAGSLASPYKTFKKGFDLLPDGNSQGVVLLKNNDVFKMDHVFIKPDGLAGKPNVVAPYGSGSCPRLVDSVASAHLGSGNGDGVNDIAFIGLCFNHSLKDPASSTHNLINQSGINSEININTHGKNVLLEGLSMRYSPIIASGGISNVIIRRSVIADNYSISAHAQGIYTGNVNGITLEENVLDHNGWLQRQYMGRDNPSQGQGTIYNHNTYFTNTSNVVMKRNVFMRPSSIQNKFTSNSSTGYDEIKSSNITIDNNFYYDGEVMLSIGGNTDYNQGPRFRNVKILNNVFTEAGTSRPTNRTIAWGIDVSDWAGGEVKRNILTNFVPGNGYHLSVKGHTSDVVIEGNVFYHAHSTALNSGAGLVKFSTQLKNITFSNNRVQAPNSSQILISMPADAVGKIRFSGNVYYSRHPKPFKIGSSSYTFAEWKAKTGDTSQFVQAKFADPTRTFVKYASTKGMSLSGVYSHVRSLRKGNWPNTIAADPINKYFRSGFGVTPL